jgi:hypothetical protein
MPLAAACSGSRARTEALRKSDPSHGVRLLVRSEAGTRFLLLQRASE